jgi:hypothetical protein
LVGLRLAEFSCLRERRQSKEGNLFSAWSWLRESCGTCRCTSRRSPVACGYHKMQESFYESGSCVQIICANQGVHPTSFSPTSVQLKSEINGECSCKRHQRQHLEFFTTFFGTRRTVVQIHSPRPTLLELTTYNTLKSGRPPGVVTGAQWSKSICPDHSLDQCGTLRSQLRLQLHLYGQHGQHHNIRGFAWKFEALLR